MPRRLLVLLCVIALCIAVLGSAPQPLVGADTAGVTSLISVSSDGTQTNNYSYSPSFSADGRYVVFESLASNLVANDTNGFEDVFVHDRQTGVVSRVSIGSDGTQGNSRSWVPVFSADGRFVAFSTNTTNLVAGDTNGVQDVLVHERQTGITSRVSVSSDGTQANRDSNAVTISADGRFVAFVSAASNLVSEDTNNAADIFVHDRQTSTTSRVSVRSDGAQGNGSSFEPSISADGRFVAFSSYAHNLLAEETIESWLDVFVHDRQTGITSLVSVSCDGTETNGLSQKPAITPDGRFVAFQSEATNLIASDTNRVSDIYIHDRQTGITSLVSVSSNGTQGNLTSYYPVLSADGRFVAFVSEATNLVANDTNGVADIFIHDRQTGITSRVSVGSDGTQGDKFSNAPSLSADGRFVAFASKSTNLVIGDTNGQLDVFVHDRGRTLFPPSITDFEPIFGPVGTAVTINGANFTDATAVAFNDTDQPIFTVNPDGTQISATVPAGATTGKLSVTTPDGTAASTIDFNVIPTPDITGFAPPSGPVGTLVTISGANFTDTTAVAFNGTDQPTFTVNPDGSQISAAVPAGATTGKLSVTTSGGTATSATDFTVTVIPAAIYLSPTGTGAIAGKSFTGADILSYVKDTNTWDILYDGSYINTPKNAGAFAFVGDDILLGFSAAQVVPGLGTTKVAPQDLVRFTPASTGYNNTVGTFVWFFDGSDVGLSTSGETIDALWIDDAGRLYVSTTGAGVVPVDSANPTGAKVKFQDEDVLRFTPASSGATTAGTWELYWNPTTMTGMAAEDINGYWEDPSTGNRYVTILGKFTIGNAAYGGKFSGNGQTILRFTPNAAAPGGWAPAEVLTWLASGATFPSNIDGIEIER